MNKFLEKVVGPVIPIPTPFTANEEVDYAALSTYVDYLVSHGIKNIMTTVGTSRFNLLTDEEIKKVNQTIVEAAKGKAITMVANPITGGTRNTIAHAKHAEEIGADLFLVYFPERYYGEDNTYEYFRLIAESVKMGILIHEMPMRNGYGGPAVQYSLKLLEKLLIIENIVGLKEEALDAEYSNYLVEALSEKAVIIGAGGGMSRYFERDFARGSKAFLGGIGGFVPALELSFFEYLTRGQKEKAEKIVREIEKIYFEKVVPVGWHPSLKRALALKELLPKYERAPMKMLNENEESIVRKELEKHNWLYI